MAYSSRLHTSVLTCTLRIAFTKTLSAERFVSLFTTDAWSMRHFDVLVNGLRYRSKCIFKHPCGLRILRFPSQYRCTQVLFRNHLASDRVRIVKGYHSGIRPQAFIVLDELIRPQWIPVGHQFAEWGHVIGGSMLPPLVELAMPEGIVPQPEDLPHAILLDVFVLVHAAFPPLLFGSREKSVVHAVVIAGAHEGAKPSFGLWR